ncbi:MAG: carboxypeptidase-like regulatory domain-containing protein [Bacteroidota bacterium]
MKGKITDREGNAIEFANVYVRSQGAGTFTDRYGKFKLELKGGETVIIETSHTAFASKKETIYLEQGETRLLNFRLDFLEIKGVVIEDDRSRTSTMDKVPIKDIKLAPTVQQGIESVLTSQLGVRMNNELSSNYSVRGGSYAENLVYVNDIEVYRPFLARSGEQEGLSFPNPDMVGSINFSAGGFDARYGDRMSSVLDIQYKKPRRFGGSFSASLLGGSLALESASKNGRFRQVSGVRYLTNQYILGSLDTQGDYQPDFTDVQTYWTYDLSDKWEIAFLGNYSNNNFKFVPSTRETQFGSFNEALRFTVFFEGQEVTSFETFFGAVSTEYKPNNSTRLKFTASAFRTFEDETFDILGQYFLDELERDLGDDEFGDVVRNRGIGSYLEHARNRLDAQVYSVQHRGFKTLENKYLQWGVTWRGEEITDRLSEWSYIDSAGYSTPINPLNQIVLNDVIKGNNTILSNRLMGYVQNSWDMLLDNESRITATAGVRVNYWDYSDETVVSPRGTVSWKPKWTKQINDSTTLTRDVVFRFSSGFYYQPAFYRELRELDGTLNPDVRAQRAIHYVLGADVNFQMWNRPFKFIAEAYYKDYDFLVPYEIDNIRLRYYGTNDAVGYAVGLDTKIHGEFIPGIESWASLSFLRTEEDLLDDFYYELYNSDGELIQPGFTQNDVPVDTITRFPGYIPRPTDQLVFFSMFFQDEMPSIPSFKVHVSVLFGSGLPFGPPDFERYKDVERYRAYRRVDIGFSKDLMPKNPNKGLFKDFKSAAISLEVWNLLGINNTISYSWIQESSGRQYGVPNFLTQRRVNLKLAFSF